MVTYKIVTYEQKEFDNFYCDKCGKHIVSNIELQETYSIKFTGGFSSVFGDGSNVTCDLCQNCLKELIGDICVFNLEDEA